MSADYSLRDVELPDSSKHLCWKASFVRIPETAFKYSFLKKPESQSAGSFFLDQSWTN